MVWRVLSPLWGGALEENLGLLDPAGPRNGRTIRVIPDRGPVATRAARLRPAACLVSAGRAGWPGFGAGLPKADDHRCALVPAEDLLDHFALVSLDEADHLHLRPATGVVRFIMLYLT